MYILGTNMSNMYILGANMYI